MISYEVSIKRGDLLDEKADILVNPSNTLMLLGSGVSRAFFCRCGGAELECLMQEKLKNSPLKPGEVIKTISNNENFTHIFHAAVLNYTFKNLPKYPNLDVIKNILKNIDNEISKYGKFDIKLGIPLIGCGIGGLNKKDVINLYKKHFIKNNSANIKCKVVIYGYTKEDFNLINEIFKYEIVPFILQFIPFIKVIAPNDLNEYLKKLLRKYLKSI